MKTVFLKGTYNEETSQDDSTQESSPTEVDFCTRAGYIPATPSKLITHMDETTVPPKRGWAARILRWLVIGVLAVVVLFAAYTWVVLTWSYSKGERAGYVQKFSQKGWISKTWEGELAMVNIPGSLSEKFYFTVRDDSVAARINATMGKRVSLQYEEHVGVPTSLFGDTPYYVVGVRALE